MDAGLQSMGSLALSQAMAAKSTMPTVSAANMASIDKTSKDFEGMFMSQMIQPMFEGVGVDPVFGGGHGEEVMRSFLVQEFGKMAAKSGRIGLASAIKDEMIRLQAAGSSKINSASTAAAANATSATPLSMPSTSTSLVNGV